jgi:methyl-accepting chemotaxis protein
MKSENAYFSSLYSESDRLLFGVVSALMLISLCIAPLHDTWTAALAVGLPTWAVCGWLTLTNGGQLVTRCTIAASLMVFSALQIHQAHGMIEAHFAIFGMLALLLYYRDWIPVVVAAGVIAAHHVGFDMLQRSGTPVWVFASESGFSIVLLHATYVVFESTLLVVMAVRLRREIEATGGEPGELSRASLALANGDLSVQIATAGASPDSLVCSMERMRSNLKETLERERAVGSELKANMEKQNALVERERAANEAMREAAERERLTSEENSRIRVALDRIGAGAMVVGLNGQINYLNDFARALFSHCASAIRQGLPQFDGERLQGASLEIFGTIPILDRQVLATLAATRTDDCTLGTARLRVAVSPVVDNHGKRLGTVVQWQDRTREVQIEDEIKSVVARANDGELTVRLTEVNEEGFFRSLAVGMNSLLSRLEVVISQVKSAATQVHQGATEISRGNANLSQRTEEQASSLEETASSMEQMTSTVRQNADSAGQASRLAVAAREQAEKGGAVVSRAVKAMTGINDASNKIADIIGVIDEIAFQTNLLALNAAVEAARAGEQGRGFAVVASEVRNLASRSATAAKEIKALIQDSVIRVEEGSSLVTDSGTTLEQIVFAVKKVADIVAEIASASQEQSGGIEQVNKAVLQLDELTQQNAALVEEASAASQAMAEQARQLNDTMAHYRVSIDRTRSDTGTYSTAEQKRGEKLRATG